MTDHGLEGLKGMAWLLVLQSLGELLAHALHSQVAMHADYGGVVPELTSRDHIRRIIPLANQALAQAGQALAAIKS